jgi:hypothetical protein
MCRARNGCLSGERGVIRKRAGGRGGSFRRFTSACRDVCGTDGYARQVQERSHAGLCPYNRGAGRDDRLASVFDIPLFLVVEQGDSFGGAAKDFGSARSVVFGDLFYNSLDHLLPRAVGDSMRDYFKRFARDYAVDSRPLNSSVD